MPEIPVVIQGFKGINLREPPGMVQDDELVTCNNLNIGRAGELTKRKGFVRLHNGSVLGQTDVIMLGQYETAEFSQLLCITSNNELYRSNNGSTWTLIDDDVPIKHGVQYVNKFYMASDDGVYVWDGTDLELIEDTPEGNFCLVYKDRLYVLSSKSENNSRLYFSAIADFEEWPSTNFLDVRPGDGDFLVTCAIIQDLLLIFKSETTWALYVQGAPQNWVLRNVNPEIGCISKHTPREIEGFLYFVGSRGIYKTDGNIFEDISESIEPIFRERIVNQTTVNIDSASWWEDRYIVLLHPNPSTFRYFVFHLRTEGWTEWVPNAGVRPYTFTEVVSATPAKGLYCGSKDSSGRVFRHGDDTFLDSGQSYPCKFRTKDFDFSLPSMMKRGKWIGLDVHVTGTNSYIQHKVDEEYMGQVPVESGTGRRLYKLLGPGYFRIWNMEMFHQSSQPFTFYSTTLWMHRKRSTIKAYT
jgi:hypothetical protein